jgi:hypothetical protein
LQAKHLRATSISPSFVSFQALYFQCDFPKLEQRIASSAAIDFDFHFVVALQVQEYFDRSATMGSSEYDDEIYDDDESEDDEDGKNYDPPRELTPKDIAGIASLNSEGQLQDLIEDIDANLAVIKLREWADLKAERLENLKKAHRAPRCQHVRLNDKACGSPAVSGQTYCHFHGQATAPVFEFPVIEDGRSFQVAVMRLCQQIAKGAIDPANAKLLLQALSMAAENIRQTTSLR